MRGLLGRGGLERGEGLLLQPAGSIHTFFMRFPIDAVFLDRGLRVVGLAPELAPWRLAARRHAHSVLELAAGGKAWPSSGATTRRACSSSWKVMPRTSPCSSRTAPRSPPERSLRSRRF